MDPAVIASEYLLAELKQNKYYTILYYTILYYTILYYTILYYTILYYTPGLKLRENNNNNNHCSLSQEIITIPVPTSGSPGMANRFVPSYFELCSLLILILTILGNIQYAIEHDSNLAQINVWRQRFQVSKDFKINKCVYIIKINSYFRFNKRSNV